MEQGAPASVLAMLSKVPSGRSHRSGRSGGGQESAIHGVAESDAADLSPKSQVQIIISEIEDFDDIAREPSLHLPGRNDAIPARPATVKTDTDPSAPPEFESETDKAISIGTPGTRQKTRTGSGAPPLCHRFLWAKCWQDRRWRKCGFVAAALTWLMIITVAVSVGVLWPRHPSYRLTRLQMDVDALMSLVTAASGAATESANQVPDQVFRAEVEMKNPNLVGAETQPGNIHFIFQGREVGTGTTQPASLPPQSTATVVAEGALQVDKELLDAIAGEMATEVPLLTFEVVAKSEFQSIFGVELNYTLHCKIDFSIPDLMMSDTRARAVTGRECKHAYF